MSTKRLILSVVVVFVTLFATNFLIHQVWLIDSYKSTASLWRTETEMQKTFPFLLLGQLLAAITFTVIWSKGLSAVSTPFASCLYGLTMALYAQSGTFITYAVQPMPGDLMVRWAIAGLAQGVVLGLIIYLVGRPRATAAASPA